MLECFSGFRGLAFRGLGVRVLRFRVQGLVIPDISPQ